MQTKLRGRHNGQNTPHTPASGDAGQNSESTGGLKARKARTRALAAHARAKARARAGARARARAGARAGARREELIRRRAGTRSASGRRLRAGHAVVRAVISAVHGAVGRRLGAAALPRRDRLVAHVA